jgi:hypothetical protein
MPPKYPQVTVRLSGHDGNAFMILGLCQRAAKEAGLTKEELDAFHIEATSGDYEHLLQTAARWFNCE